MDTTVIRRTYALDEETVRTIAELAREWKVSESEAVRRSVQTAYASVDAPDTRLSALDDLQASMRLSAARAQAWVRDVRHERRKSAERPIARR